MSVAQVIKHPLSGAITCYYLLLLSHINLRVDKSKSIFYTMNQKRVADMSTFLKKQPAASHEYGKQLVRRLIEKVIVYTASVDAVDKFTVEFKSGTRNPSHLYIDSFLRI